MNAHPDLTYIHNKKLRDVTLSKRKQGILKKAIELSVLCNLKICLFIQDDSRSKAIHFMSNPEMDFLEFFNKNQTREFYTTEHYRKFGGQSSDDVMKSKAQKKVEKQE